MRYMAKVLKASLNQRFPEAAEKDVLKVRIQIEYSYVLLSLLTDSLLEMKILIYWCESIFFYMYIYSF